MSHFNTTFSSGLTSQVVNATGASAFTSAYTSYEDDNEILPELLCEWVDARRLTNVTAGTWLELDYNCVANGVAATSVGYSLRHYSEG